MRVPWTARRSNQSILKKISPGISLEEMMLKLKLQYFGHLMRRVDSLEKTDAGRDWGQEEKGTAEAPGLQRPNRCILEEINPEYPLEGLTLKLQYFGHLMQRANLLEKT